MVLLFLIRYNTTEYHTESHTVNRKYPIDESNILCDKESSKKRKGTEQ